MIHKRLCVWTLVALLSPAVLAEPDFIPFKPLHEIGLQKYWQLQLKLEDDQKVQDVYLVDDHLYVGTQDGYCYCVHAPTGAIRWLRPITSAGYSVRRPCHTDEWTIFVTPTDIQVYRRHTGAPVVRRELRFPPGTPAITDGTRLFIGGVDRRMHTFMVENLFPDWELLVGAPITSTPALYGEHLFFANDLGIVYSCTRENKVYHWQSRTYDRVSASLVAREDGVYVASRDQSLYLLPLGGGRSPRWRARFSGPLYEAPVITDELAFQFCPDDGLAAVEVEAIEAVDNRIRWTLPQGRKALGIRENQVFVLSRDEALLAVDMKTGEIQHTVPIKGFSLSIPAVDRDALYLVSPDGRLFCARPEGTPPLSAEDLLAALQPPKKPSDEAEKPATDAEETATADEAERDATDPLRSKRRGAPIGGKSKVSKRFTGEQDDEN